MSMGFERAREYDFRPVPTILGEAHRLMLPKGDRRHRERSIPGPHSIAKRGV
jgi:hypothetical protein